jgi:hypothetical protein
MKRCKMSEASPLFSRRKPNRNAGVVVGDDEAVAFALGRQLARAEQVGMEELARPSRARATGRERQPLRLAERTREAAVAGLG